MITPKFKIWLKAALIRALRTFAQTAASQIVVGAALQDVNWAMVGSISLVACILSLLTSIGGLPEADAEDEARKLAESRRLNGQEEK